MFGYATNETEELMLAPIQYSHSILRRFANVRKNGTELTLGPYAKSQLSVCYENGKLVDVTSDVLSTQYFNKTVMSDDVRLVVEPYICENLSKRWITVDAAWHANPTGKFVIGGPDGDAGVTGRYLVKNVVATGLVDKFIIQRSCAVGVARLLSIYADTHCAGHVSEDQIEKAVSDGIELTSCGIRMHLGLNNPIYQRTSVYGHFGRAPDADGGFSRVCTDLVDALKIVT